MRRLLTKDGRGEQLFQESGYHDLMKWGSSDIYHACSRLAGLHETLHDEFLTSTPFGAIQQAFAIGMGMVLGAINVFFRDVGHFLNIVMQFWFWLTPIVYPLNILLEKVRHILEFNPMTKLIIAYQQIILYGRWPDWVQFRFHIIGALLSLIVGYLVFKGLSDDIVDEL